MQRGVRSVTRVRTLTEMGSRKKGLRTPLSGYNLYRKRRICATCFLKRVHWTLIWGPWTGHETWHLRQGRSVGREWARVRLPRKWTPNPPPSQAEVVLGHQ